MEEKLLTIGQAAEYLDVSINTLRRWDESGKLIAIHKEGGTHRYYREKDLEVFSSDLFKFATEWVKYKTEFSKSFYCDTSSSFQARLAKMEQALMKKPGFEKLYSLIVLVAGEIGDNSFAHNLGNWPDIPGIFFGYDLQKNLVILADRGVGILETLKRIRPELQNHVAAIKVAFTEFVSGRSPEKRGNGLKLVKDIVETNPINLFFTSGDAEIRMKDLNKEFIVTRGVDMIRGCLAKITF